MASVKNNIILNGLNTVSSLIFPLVTFPYAARVLLPEGIGLLNFYNSVIGYILLLTSLGIPMYAVKEIGRVRDNIKERNKVAAEITLLSLSLCFFGYIVVFILIKFVPQITEHYKLFLILSLTLIFNSIGVNWFYQGIEDFKFITIRALIFRFMSAISLFVFVKNPNDILLYGWIIVGSTVGNNIVNFYHLKNFLSPSDFYLRNINIWRHFRPVVHVFILNLISSLYIQLNPIMLGFLSNDSQVGYFVAGTKITHVAITLISSLGVVMIPRCSNLLQKGDYSTFSHIINKSLDLNLALSYPMMGGLFTLASSLTYVFCGPEYGSAIPVLLWNIPVVFLINITTMTGLQILYPLGKIKLVIYSVSIGAVINICLNLILIPKVGALGASIATTMTEIIVFIVQLSLGRKSFPFSLRKLFNIRYIIGTTIMCILVYFATIIFNGNSTKVLIGILVGASTYFTTMYLLKDQVINDIFLQIFSICKIRK